MFLRQQGDKIVMGTADRQFEFKIGRSPKFKRGDVEAARTELLANVPDEADAVNRYADRLLRVLG